MTHRFLGTHIISDFYGIAQTINSKELLCIICESCTRNNLTLLDSGVYKFENGGFTLYCLLAESHISVHYYIEEQAAFVDIFTCGQNDPLSILDDFRCYCMPIKENTHCIERGKRDA